MTSARDEAKGIKMKQEIAIEFGSRLQALRKSLKLTQREIAAKIGVASSYISEIESGKTRPGFEFLYKISDHYKLNPLFLFHGQEPMLLDKALPDREEPGLADFGGNKKRIIEMLKYMEESPMVLFAMLEHFAIYTMKHKDLIKENIATTKLEE